MADTSIIAADLGGTRLRVAVARSDGTVLGKRVMPTPPDDPAALPSLMRQVLEEAQEALAGAVVGVPGPIDYSSGSAIKLPNVSGWDRHLTSALLSEELDVPVLLANDADLAALGEHRFGAGVGSADMVYLTASTGIGAGVIVGGKLLHGRLSLAEVGHTIIDHTTRETVESLGAGPALARLAGEDASAVTNRALQGDREALGFVSRVAGAFAVGVYNAVHSYMPELVVVGGGMSQLGDLLLEPVRVGFTQCPLACACSRVRVVLASGGDDVGLRGAAAFWADREGHAGG